MGNQIVTLIILIAISAGFIYLRHRLRVKTIFSSRSKDQTAEQLETPSRKREP